MDISDLVLRAIGLLFLALLIRFFTRLYQIRSLFRDAASKHGVPMMPHSFLFGHFPSIIKATLKYPRDINGQCVPLLLLDEYPELRSVGALYMDVWPIAPPMIAVFHPDMMAQYTQTVSLPKASIMRREFYPFTQCNDLVNQDGKEWRTWRSIFNPGFSMNNIIALVLEFLEEIQVFKDWLISVAKSGEEATLDDRAMKVAVDVIGRAVLGVRLESQTAGSALFNALRDSINWLVTDNSPASLARLLNPFRLLIMRRNNRIMKKALLPLIRKGIAGYGSGDPRRAKTINSLAIKSYLREVPSAKQTNDKTLVDPAFIEMVISQMKMFLFAGHDTTSSTVCFLFHLLHTHPDKLAKLRAELDGVFGPDPSQTLPQLQANPHLLNQLPYAAATIKETLRLYTPVGGVRQGQEGFFLTHPSTGQRFPTAGLMLMSAVFASHRLPEFWPHADSFLPERWLAREGEALHVRRNAFRPFDVGARACIGQELVMVELRAILAMTVRDLDVESAYPPDGAEFLGSKAYQVLAPGQVLAHPKDEMPVRVRIRDGKVER